MSTFSPSLRIELITTGDQAGVWGNTTNTNLGTLVESAIAGYVSVAIVSASQALTAVNGAADQSRNMAIALTTLLTAPFNVYAPPAEKTYVIYNASAYAATLYNSTVLGNTTAAGLGVTIPAGRTITVWSDGTNFAFQNNHLSSLTLVTDLAVADGGTGASDAATARTNLGLGTIATQNSSSVSITGGTIIGITDLAVADGGTGASDAATARTNLGLGTISTQNASAVAITGGSITGITDLAVADGGTGASDAATARTNLGLGTMATQAASAVAITGGSITGITDLAVADGGTGASSFTSGALLKGAGTAAIAVASAADIVGQISTTAVTNAVNATTSTTQAYGTNTTAIATTAFVIAALQILHPIGSIYINAGVTTNPATLLGFGTWAAFGAGRVMVGLNGADPLFDALEETGGSKDAIVVSHTHTGTTDTNGNHSHSYRIGSVGSFNNAAADGNGSLGSVATTDAAGAHSHSFTTASTGSSGTNANLQPYITVAMWKRTA